jgi:hypothetical protein
MKTIILSYWFDFSTALAVNISFRMTCASIPHEIVIFRIREMVKKKPPFLRAVVFII